MKSAERYGWGSQLPSCSHIYLQPAVLRLLKQAGVGSVFDIGCGNGVTLSALSAAGFRSAGCEPDAEGCVLAQRQAPDAAVSNLGVYDDPGKVTGGPFDAAISMEVLEHLFDPGMLFDFASGLIKPGGMFIVTTPYHGYAKNLALSLTGKWDDHFHPARVGGHIKFWSKATLQALCLSRGFSVIHWEGAGRLPYLWKSMILVARKR